MVTVTTSQRKDAGLNVAWSLSPLDTRLLTLIDTKWSKYVESRCFGLDDAMSPSSLDAKLSRLDARWSLSSLDAKRCRDGCCVVTVTF